VIEPPSQQIRRHLKVLILRACDVTDVPPDEIDDDAPLFGPEGKMDLSSLDSIEIAMMLDHEFKIKVENASTARAHFQSVSALAEFVAAQADPELLRKRLEGEE
jgi:acyl carrier protein